MRSILIISRSALALCLIGVFSCGDILTETNESPNVVDPSSSNPNMIMPSIMAPAASDYLNKGWGHMGGVVQHIQHDGWFGGVNHYEWGPENWNHYYDMLRNAEFLRKSPSIFHQGIALTMRGHIFGMITDLWGDAPYTEALQGERGLLEPQFDSQETIYRGIIEELKEASGIFALNDNSGYLTGYDTYYGGDTQKWHKFANSLLLRYYMRLSEKLPDLAKSGIEAVYRSGVYIKEPADDASITYVGTVADNSWPFNYQVDQSALSDFRRKKPAQTLINQLMETQDPRLELWFAPVHVQWVEDTSLPTAVDPFIRKNGTVMEGVAYMPDADLKREIEAGNVFKRHYNPDIYQGPPLDTNRFVGVPPGLTQPDYHNGNPTPGQTVENQHVSQLSDLYRYSNNPRILKGRIITSAEVHFILAEAAFRGWAVGDAETHYNNAIKASLETWELGNLYDEFITQEGVAYNGTLEQILTQKWVASWSSSTEAWMDYRRTGIPNLQAGPAAAKSVLPVRFIYGDSETFNNQENSAEAISRLEETSYSIGKNSLWSKPWIVQGTGKPW